MPNVQTRGKAGDKIQIQIRWRIHAAGMIYAVFRSSIYFRLSRLRKNVNCFPRVLQLDKVDADQVKIQNINPPSCQTTFISVIGNKFVAMDQCKKDFLGTMAFSHRDFFIGGHPRKRCQVDLPQTA